MNKYLHVLHVRNGTYDIRYFSEDPACTVRGILSPPATNTTLDKVQNIIPSGLLFLVIHGTSKHADLVLFCHRYGTLTRATTSALEPCNSRGDSARATCQTLSTEYMTGFFVSVLCIMCVTLVSPPGYDTLNNIVLKYPQGK